MGNMSFIYTRDTSRTLGWTSKREVKITGLDARTRGNENQ